MSTRETPRIIDRQEDFTREIGITPEKWSPINVAPVKLRELKEELTSLTDDQKKQKTQEFIDKYRVSDAPANTVAPAAGVAAVAGGAVAAAEVASSAGTKAAVVGIWNRLTASVEKSGGFVKELWNEFRTWLTDSIPTEKPKLWDDPMGWLKYTFLGFLKPGSSETPNADAASANSDVTPADGNQTDNNPDKRTPDVVRELVDQTIVSKTSGFLMKRVGERGYESFFGAVKKATWDATVGKDEAEKKKKIRETAATILGYETISTVKIGDIIKNKDAENIDSILGVRLSDSADQRGTEKLAIRYMADALSKNESFINMALKGTEYEGKWKEMETGKFLRHFYEYTALGTLEKLTTAVSNIDFKQPTDVIQDQLGKLLISMNDGKFEGIIADHLKPLESEGVDSEVIRRIFFSTEGDRELVEYRSTLGNLKYKNDSAQKFMEKLTKKGGFSRSIPGMMQQVGLGPEYTNLLQNGEKIQMKELLSIYAITRGETNMEKLTIGQQSQLLPILYMIAASKNPSSFAAETFSATLKESKNPYVRRVSEFVGESLSDATYTSILVSAGVARETVLTFLKLRETNPQVFYGTILAIMIAGIFVGRYRKALFLMGATTTVASFLVGLAVTQKASA